MSHEIRADYGQVLMFPPVVEDWVGPDHPARFTREFVDSLDLRSLGFRVRASRVGRPNYSADLLLKVWLFGYLSKIRSSRKLERACRENMGFIWLTGMNYPDHNSPWRFWRDNRETLRTVFKQSVKVALDAKLLGLVMHAVDGTKIMANCSRRGVLYREDLEKQLSDLDEAITKVMEEVESAERNEAGEYRLPPEMQDQAKLRESIKESMGKLDAADREHMHPGEPDARLMKSNRRTDPSYNGQAVADEKSGMIVAEDLVTDENDMEQLVPMLERVEENVGKTADETLADGGYATGAQLDKAEKREYEVLTKPGAGERKAKSVRQKKPCHTSWFTYDPQRDICICPHGTALGYERTKADRSRKHKVRVYRCRDFRHCAFRLSCSRDKRGRSIEISPYYEAAARQRKKRAAETNKELIKARNGIVEPVFAWIKRHHGFTRFTVAGLQNAKTQWSLICATINLGKLYKCWLAGQIRLAPTG